MRSCHQDVPGTLASTCSQVVLTMVRKKEWDLEAASEGKFLHFLTLSVAIYFTCQACKGLATIRNSTKSKVSPFLSLISQKLTKGTPVHMVRRRLTPLIHLIFPIHCKKAAVARPFSEWGTLVLDKPERRCQKADFLAYIEKQTKGNRQSRN